MKKSRKFLFILVCCILCIVGFTVQKNSEKKNIELKQQAQEETQIAIDDANKKIDNIIQEIEQLQNMYSEKQQRVQLMAMMNYTWSPEYS